jgi:large subunit ribosomal protein L24
VIAGKSKGKTGRVLRVIVAKNRVLVEGVGMIKKHMKPNPQRNIAGGILEQEAPIHISNVMLVDSEGKKTRVGFKIEGETKTRIARSNGGAIVEKKAAIKK